MESLLPFLLTILSGSINLHKDRNVERWFDANGRGKSGQRKVTRHFGKERRKRRNLRDVLQRIEQAQAERLQRLDESFASTMKLLESREQEQAAPDNLNQYLEQTLFKAKHVSERRQHWLLLALDDARLDGQTDRRIGDLMREFIRWLQDSEDDESEYQEELDRGFRRALHKAKRKLAF